jgi:hypothetical protein
MAFFLKHNLPSLANAKIKANLFALIKNLVFDKMYVIKNLDDSRGLPQEYKIYEIEFLRDSRTPLKF